MPAVLTALSLALAFLRENPGTVLSALSALAGAVFYVRRLLKHRLKPEERERVLAIALPLIAGAKSLAEKTKTPWDNVAVGLAERIAQELQSEGLDLPGAPKLVAKTITAEAEVEAVTAKLVARALKSASVKGGR